MKGLLKDKKYRVYVAIFILLLISGIGFFFRYRPHKVEEIEFSQEKLGGGGGEEAVDDFKEETTDLRLLEEKRAILVRVLRIKRTDFQDILPAVGNLKPINEIRLRFEINGVIEKFYFEESDHIKKGDLIASLRKEDALLKLKHAQAKLSSSESAYAASKKKLEIYQGLYDIGALIKPKLDEAKMETESIRLQMETYKVEVEIAKAELAKTELYAWREGVLGKKDAEPGEFVTPNSRVASLMDVSKVIAEFGIIEKDIDKITLGQKVEVTVDAYSGIVFWGKIDNIFPVVEGRSRTLTVQVNLANDKGLLIPGMFCRVKVYLVDLKDAIVIPADILIPRGLEYALPIVEEEAGKKVCHIRKVSVGYITREKAQIISGLEEGDLVIVESQAKLQEGLEVEIMEEEEGLI